MQQFVSGRADEARRKEERARRRVKKEVAKIRLLNPRRICQLAEKCGVSEPAMRNIVGEVIRQAVAGW